MSQFRRDPAHISIGGWPAWLLMTDRVYAALTTNADYQAAQCNSLTLAATHHYPRAWRGASSIHYRHYFRAYRHMPNGDRCLAHYDDTEDAHTRLVDLLTDLRHMAQRNRNLEAAHETLYEFMAALPKEDA